ncbi:hypothetical protein [Paenibacillus sp. GP183]|uniref:hypothetical protein n=1 Tax=Paenibacillus sp. GP183 TaxID=1882751 RepID=UPI00089D810D|nr:hypothetical protein [Paenibacillus sp. GP183]SEC75994.1 hypothetical protein SAMN05443246_5273 [Paenibacillus sp. GP183]
MKENPYFSKSGAPINEQVKSDEIEQSGSYPKDNNDDNIQIESEEVGLKNGDITIY